MKALRFAAILLVAAMPAAFAQTTKVTANATITVTVPAPLPAIAISPNAISVVAGQAATLNVNVTQSGLPATGGIDLCGKVPGSNTLTFVQSFQLVNGVVTCSYPVPTSTPAGSYSVQAQFPSDGRCD